MPATTGDLLPDSGRVAAEHIPMMMNLVVPLRTIHPSRVGTANVVGTVARLRACISIGPANPATRWSCMSTRRFWARGSVLH